MKRSSIVDGCILAFQFFSTIPIKIAIPWDDKRAKWSVRFYPFVGLIFGLATYGIFLAIDHFTPISPLATSIILLLLPILLTGGLHMDGFLDCSDAFFSYRDPKRRLEIMKDSRVGAFGVLALLIFLLTKWLFIFETIQSPKFFSLSLLFVFIPIFSRTWIGFLFVYGKPAASSGIAFEMKKYLIKRDSYYFLAVLLVVVSFFSYWNGFLALIFVGLLTLYFIGTYFFYHRNFGGITGDMLGAYIEGQEWFMWGILWVLHYFVTA